SMQIAQHERREAGLIRRCFVARALYARAGAGIARRRQLKTTTPCMPARAPELRARGQLRTTTPCMPARAPEVRARGQLKTTTPCVPARAPELRGDCRMNMTTAITPGRRRAATRCR